MKKILFALLVFVSLGLAACAGKDTLKSANIMLDQKKYSEAIPYFTQVIEQWPDDRQVTGALYGRAQCFEALGDYQKAFGNYYAAQAMSCMAVKSRLDPNPSWSTLSLSAFCDDILPKKLLELEPKVPQEQRAESIQSVRSQMPKNVNF